ncbi:PLP-dependent aminotransferase family protein [Novosphingobium sp. SG720]|uniref:MocR-like pyridoxine biosynthesis transcription factor PdxR n=1 Tax=Novosphingobium sp. SG720 TaxID=2586998 RepID=UPI0014452217|nr:PLP-dependent aminotransferase family protein [Novosphingobium sp. SG720]NKJ42061.1 GntR family transcriptional regulator/MocR family aminotransferase [Novosphingobium sp. SG720]
MAIEPTTWLVLDRAVGDLEGQIYRAFRARILGGALQAGAPLPSTRALAAALGLARSTVVAGYDRLAAEGYVNAARGSATRVAPLPPPPQGAADGRSFAPVPPPGSPDPARFLPLRPGLPDLEAFPHATWARCLAARARGLRVHDLGYGDEQGLPILRAAVLDHVRRTRAVVADPAQVVIVPSTAAAVALLAGLVLAPGDAAWVEDPGYPTARALLQRAGARIAAVPVDVEGIDLGQAPAGPPPRLIHVTPSHQYPTGAAMSLARRLRLLDHAAACGALVVEDDYDSEFHYAGRPLASLQGLDERGCVAYLGTFSKVLAPGLRIAYAIVPPRLVAPMQAAVRLSGGTVPMHLQAAMADFLEEGHLNAHVRRMRKVYHARMVETAERLDAVAAGRWRAGPVDGGLQLALWLASRHHDDTALARQLQDRGLGVLPLSGLFVGPAQPGLLIGVATAQSPVIDRLAAALDALVLPSDSRDANHGCRI